MAAWGQRVQRAIRPPERSRRASHGQVTLGMQSVAEPDAEVQMGSPHGGRVWVWAAMVLVVALVIAGFEAEKHWPYRYRNVEPMLQGVFASQIKIDQYHRIYWPHPGFVAQGITLRRNTAPDLPPVGSADELLVQGGWADLVTFRRRVLLVEVKGMHVVIPPAGSRANREDFPPGSSGDFTGPKTRVDVLHLVDATLELMQGGGGRLRFPIHDLRIHDLKSGDAVRYEVDMANAKPAGQILADGSFGPVKPNNLGDTPLSGHFRYGPVDLAQIGNLRGTLSSEGEFRGTLASVEAAAKEQTRDFAVAHGRPVEVDGSVQGTVNALNGDVVLHQIDVKTGATALSAAGWVRGSPKVTELDVEVEKGRAEDLLGPFLKHTPPITGMVWLKSHAHLDPSVHGAKFLDRLKMDGTFSIPRERLTSRSTEQSLTAFSERAQGGHETKQEAAPTVVSSLVGTVAVRHGVALARDLRFEVPGAAAKVSGTYGLQKGEAKLHGTLRMDSDLSHVTTGWKAMLLKPLAPFFRKKPAGAVIPVKVTGRPGNYKVGANLMGGKDKSE